MGLVYFFSWFGLIVLAFCLHPAQRMVHWYLLYRSLSMPSATFLLVRDLYFSGMKREECVAPIPGLPCLTGLLYQQSVSRSQKHRASICKVDSLRDGKLSQIMSHHLRLDLNLIELFARVHADHAANHLRHDDHVSEMCLDRVRLLVGLRLLLGFAQLLDQTHGLALETAIESAPGAGVNDIAELFGGEVEEARVREDVLAMPSWSEPGSCAILYSLIELNTPVGELAERSLLLQLCSYSFVSRYPIFRRPFVAMSTGFQSFGVRIPAASSAFCAMLEFESYDHKGKDDSDSRIPDQPCLRV